MLFAIHMLDRDDGAELRAQHAQAHRNFVGAYLDKMLVGGPLLDDDGKTLIGSLIVMDFANRQAAAEFIAAEPYNAAGLFERVTITGFSAVAQPAARSSHLD